MLADTAEVHNTKTWRCTSLALNSGDSLRYNFDRASAFNVISILESIRNMQAAKKVQDVMSKLNALERRHQEYHKQAAEPKEPEFVNMNTHGISVYTEESASRPGAE